MFVYISMSLCMCLPHTTDSPVTRCLIWNCNRSHESFQETYNMECQLWDWDIERGYGMFLAAWLIAEMYACWMCMLNNAQLIHEMLTFESDILYYAKTETSHCIFYLNIKTVSLCACVHIWVLPRECAAVVLELKNRPRPRSPSLTSPVAVMKTFDGFISNTPTFREKPNIYLDTCCC